MEIEMLIHSVLSMKYICVTNIQNESTVIQNL